MFLTLPWRLIPIYGTVWIISHRRRHALPGLWQSHDAFGAVLQLHHDLEEAAQVGGVSWLNTLRYIVLPLLLPPSSRAGSSSRCTRARDDHGADAVFAEQSRDLAADVGHLAERRRQQGRRRPAWC